MRHCPVTAPHAVAAQRLILNTLADLAARAEARQAAAAARADRPAAGDPPAAATGVFPLEPGF